MITHIELPIELTRCIKPFNLQELKEDIDKIKIFRGHGWTYKSLDTFLTKEGIDWFVDNGFDIKGMSARVFKAVANAHTPIHNDWPGSYAFNFVLQGHGRMEWLKIDADIIGSTYTAGDGTIITYPVYTNIRNPKILNTWEGQAALVRTNIPHRIVVGSEDRYCLSITPELTFIKENFDKVVNRLF